MIELRPIAFGDGPELYQLALEIGPGENGFVNGLYAGQYSEFESKLKSYIDMSAGSNLAPNLVPQTTYLLLIDGYSAGYGKIRHRLNDQLKRHGGHIGYVIRPSLRGMGYGKLMLGLLVQEASKLGIEDALLTCNADNWASRKIIEHNDGRLAGTDAGTCRYWICTG
ncbi:GNAT family N-acetyltransferase [Paenibacillus aurantiacus]|uniref:GNAT family N-acetyltransferase n=1 Tax=Paenibacillus aurantiacus TaxID=1936118 RepID=A0ABV5KW27_9BACL